MKVFLVSLLRQYDWTVTPGLSELAPILQPSKVQEDLQAQLTRL